MKYNRIFYANIIYRCNNHCSYCISHNTVNKTNNEILGIEDIQFLHKKEKISSSDLFIISGGEPTISSEFESIVNYLEFLCCNIIIYTNGTNKIKQELLDYPNIRVIIPLYGLKEFHNTIIGNPTGYDRTIQFLKTCLFPEKIDLKILISDKTNASEVISIISNYRNTYKRIHISGITDKAFNTTLSNFLNIERIVTFLLREKIEFKFSNIPLCKIKCVMEILEVNNKYESLFATDKAYFVGIKTWREINYNKMTNWYEDCKKCRFNALCTNTNLRFPVLLVNDGKVFLEEE